MNLGDKLTKTISVLIVWCMISSSLIGLAIFTSHNTVVAANIGNSTDVFIGSDFSKSTLTFQGGIVTLGYNLTVRSGGVVLIENCDFRVVGNYDPSGFDENLMYHIIVEDGGQLFIVNSTVTNQLVNQNQAAPGFGLLVRNGASMVVEDSTLSLPGHFVVDNAQLLMYNSTIMGMDTTNVNPTYFPNDFFNDAPVMMFMSSDIQLYDSRLLDTFDSKDYADYPSIYSFNYGFASETSAKNTVTYVFQRNVLPGLAAGSTGSIPSADALQMNDSKRVTLASGQTLTTLGFDTAGMAFTSSNVVSIVLNVNYTAPSPFSSTAGADEIYYKQPLRTNNATTLTITPSWDAVNGNWNKTKTYTLPNMSSQDLNRTIVNLTNSRASPVYINRIWVDITLRVDSYRNITLAGSTNFLAVNSEIDANNYNYSDPFNYTYNKLTMLDQAKAYLYGTKLTTDTGSVPNPWGVSPVETVNRTYILTATTKDPLDNTGANLLNLVADDGNFYDVLTTQQLNVYGFNTNGLSGEVSSAKIWVRYYTDSPFTGTNYMQWNLTGSSDKSNVTQITFKALPERVSYYDLYSNGITTISDLASLHISYVNNAGTNLHVERLWIEATLEPSAYIYRWANFSVSDSQGTPVDNASIELTDRMGDSAPMYFTPAGWQTSPQAEVLDYLGVTAVNYNRTNALGQASIPVLTEIVTAYGLPRSVSPYGPGAPLTYGVNIVYRTSPSTIISTTTADIGFAQFPEMLVTGEVINATFSNLILDKPDLTVISIGYLPNPIYEDSVGAILNATVKNRGKTAALNVKVQFTDEFEGLTYVGNVTIPSLLPDAWVSVQVSWNDLVAGTHKVTVFADAENQIMEESESNNILSENIVVLPLLPQLSVSNSEIYFSMYPAMTGMPLTINATVSNDLGRATAVNATVDFYAGNPSPSGLFIGQAIVTVAVGAHVNASITWTPSTMGTVPIYVEIGNVVEYNHDNDIAHRDLAIGEPVNNRILINGPMYINSYRNDQHNYIVESGGMLMLNSTLFLSQAYDNQLWVVVKDNGKLVLNGGSIASDRALTVFLSGTANLTIYGQAAAVRANGVVTIVMDGNSSVFVKDSSFDYDIQAPSTSYADLVAINTVFGRPWTYFGGQATADLTNVSIPVLSPADAAEIRCYRWVDVTTYDGTGIIKLSGVVVQLKDWNSATPTLYASGVTDINSKVRFKALSDIITSGSSTFYGNYRVNGSYHYDGKVAKSQVDSEVSLMYYSAPLTQSNDAVSVVIPVYLSDVAIFTSDVTFSPTSPVKNETTTISANVHNVGSQEATNVNVSFFLNTTGSKVWFASRIIASMPAGQSFAINVPWTPKVAGAAVVTIIVDEGRLLNESTRANNQVNMAVTVLEVPHLYASGLSFYPEGGSTPVTQAYVDTLLRVEATVVNNGESAATEFMVSFWAESPTGKLLGSTIVTTLAVGATTKASIVWDVASVSGQGIYQNRSIFVVFDKYTKTADVPVSQVLMVIDNRPDTAIVDAVVTKGGASTASAYPGESVKVSFNVTNIGMTAANNVQMLVNLTSTSGINHVIGNFTATLAPGERGWYNVTWVVGGVSIGAYQMNIWANPQVKFEEGNLANNHYVLNFTVATIVDPVIVIGTGGRTDYKPTESILVTGYIQSKDGLRLENTTITVSLTDSQGFVLGNVQTTTTDGQGYYAAVLIVPQYDKTDAFVTVTLATGATPIASSTPIKIITSSATAVPWWMLLIIVLVIVLIIIAFSVYLYRYGLGKMVECGECGALIPENSKRCPRCGTAFETGTAKCSECGAWIPVNSTECPECHAKFLSGIIEGSEEDAYNKAMRQQYDDYVNEFRERAKVAQGAKYSEERFQEWLKTEPGFMTYNDWLRSKEEEKKAGAFPCPSCGTLNPRGSTICHKCGTVFASSGTEDKPRTFRKIVKRSSEKKTVKKEDEQQSFDEGQKPPEQQ